MDFPPGFHIRSNGIRQHYLRCGTHGPRLVIVTGIVSPAVLWAHVAQWLSAWAQCFVLDVRGRGLSESGAHLDYGLDACTEDLCAFLNDTGDAPALVMGHSMGARIAVRAAARQPHACAGLVLLDPPTSGPGRRPYPIPAERTLALLRAAHRGEAASALASAPAWPDELQRLRAEWLPTCDERVVAAAYADFHAQDLFADLAQVQVPVSLVCAGTGGVVSEDDVADMRRLRPALEVVRIAGVGHQMQAEDFGAFRRALAGVLPRHDEAFKGMSA